MGGRFPSEWVGRIVGIRNINIFRDIILNWEHLNLYFEDIYLPKIFVQSNSELSRSLNLVEYTRDTIKSRLNYGYFNPDYPAPMRRFDFVVDIDSYCDYPQELQELEKMLDVLHSDAQGTFESLITDEMRKKLNE